MGKGLKRKPRIDTKMTDDFVKRVLYSWEKRAETLRGLGYTVFKEEGIYFYGRENDLQSFTFLEPPPEDWLLSDDFGTMSARKSILANFGFLFVVTDDGIFYKKSGQKQYRRFETEEEWIERITPGLPALVPDVPVTAPDVPDVPVTAPDVPDVPVTAPDVPDVPVTAPDVVLWRLSAISPNGDEIIKEYKSKKRAFNAFEKYYDKGFDVTVTEWDKYNKKVGSYR